MFDVIIVGAGPAGLSAALLLGRSRRRTLVYDSGRPRNAASKRLRGFLTRDGIAPAELLRLARGQLAPYETVEVRQGQVVDARHGDSGFEVSLEGGGRSSCRKLLLATGVVDDVPRIAGVDALYGKSVHHCPFCDGWEVRDQPIAVYGRGKPGLGLALEMTLWSRDLTLCTDGPAELEDDDRARLRRNDIALREERIQCLEGEDGVLQRIVFANGDVLARRALFFKTGFRQHSDLAAKLGCELTDKQAVTTGQYAITKVPGLYVAGDASLAVQLAVVAAAEGAQAAFAINTALLKEDLD